VAAVDTSSDCTFLPAKASQLKPGLTLRPRGGPGFDATVTEDAVQGVFDRFNAIDQFKNIQFQPLWDDSTVNAFAFKADDGTPVVQVMGGMLRHPFMQIEGITLVIAHEVGHHHGGPPLYPGADKMSCEGQADYWATLKGLRILYGDDTDEYKDKVTKGIEQAYHTLSAGLAYNYSSYEAQAELAFAEQCSHPHPNCRKLIYEAGVARVDKPPCLTGEAAGFVTYDYKRVTTLEDAKANFRHPSTTFAAPREGDKKKSRAEIRAQVLELLKKLESN
jgi:hypothetical protein